MTDNFIEWLDSVTEAAKIPRKAPATKEDIDLVLREADLLARLTKKLASRAAQLKVLAHAIAETPPEVQEVGEMDDAFWRLLQTRFAVESALEVLDR